MKFQKQKSMGSDIIEQIASVRGVSPEEVRQEMEYSIEAARQNPDPFAQAKFKKMFGDRTPTAEEFIKTVARTIKKS